MWQHCSFEKGIGASFASGQSRATRTGDDEDAFRRCDNPSHEIREKANASYDAIYCGRYDSTMPSLSAKVQLVLKVDVVEALAILRIDDEFALFLPQSTAATCFTAK